MTDSPVNHLLERTLIINKNDKEAVYIQIAQQIVHAIQLGSLQTGDRLPGTRVLSKILHIHRNTAVKIYEELALQGWIIITPNKGTFVNNSETKTARIPTLQSLPSYNYPTKTNFNFYENTIVSSPYEKNTTLYAVPRWNPVHLRP